MSKGWIFNDNKLDCPKDDNQIAKALVLYVKSNSGTSAFINIQVPHGYKNRDICLESLDKKFIENKNIDYVFLMGDFNNTYILETRQNPAVMSKQIQDTTIVPKYEECNDIIPSYSEDYSNVEFTSAEQVYDKVLTDRQIYKQYNYKYTLGYHNRVFHRILKRSSGSLKCIEYETIFNSPMLSANTHHLGVLGLYEIS